MLFNNPNRIRLAFYWLGVVFVSIALALVMFAIVNYLKTNKSPMSKILPATMFFAVGLIAIKTKPDTTSKLITTTENEDKTYNLEIKCAPKSKVIITINLPEVLPITDKNFISNTTLRCKQENLFIDVEAYWHNFNIVAILCEINTFKGSAIQKESEYKDLIWTTGIRMDELMAEKIITFDFRFIFIVKNDKDQLLVKSSPWNNYYIPKKGMITKQIFPYKKAN